MKSMKSRALVIAVTLMFALAASGCGTMMHPERKTATQSDKLDPTTVVLDCLWLVVGIIPGVIALGVDACNGALHYSEQELIAQAGDTVSVNICGMAPADSLVTLRLLDRDGRDLCVSAQARALCGSESGVPLALTIPDGIDLSDARIALAVDGRTQVTWLLQPRLN